METLILIVLALMGVGFHIGFKYVDHLTKNTPVNWKLLLYPSILSFAIAVVFILIRDDLSSIFPITKVSVIFLGYMADSLFKNLETYWSKKAGSINGPGALDSLKLAFRRKK